MSVADTIRAWKDVEYRLSLTDQQHALLPPHPAGDIEREDAALDIGIGYMTTFSGFEACGASGSDFII